jgi:MFS family permease
MTQAEHPTSLAALRSRYGVRYRWLLLLAVMVGTMASIMSSTIVNVAIPGMSQHFALGQERAQWVTSGFMVAMTVSMLTTPWLLARYGYRHTYVACMVLLLAGGVVGGFATRFEPGAGRPRGRGAGRGRGAADPRHHHPARLRAQ